MSVARQLARLRGLAEGVPRHPSRLAINVTHSLYYRSVIQNTWYHGVQVLKSPLDLWIYQEIIHERPADLIVETGTHHGGSALFLAHTLDRISRGHVVSIDIARRDRPQHPRITYLSGSSIDKDILATVNGLAADAQQVMVILDSDHAHDHVLAEMNAYADIVSPGHYLIVEDGNVNGHPVFVDHGPGPQEAISDFLQARSDFTVDHEREKFLVTMNPNGYLRRRLSSNAT